jgi:hypothetical protein
MRINPGGMMKSARTWAVAAQTLALAAALALGVGAGLTYAKLPQAPMDDAAKAKAADAKAAAAEAAKKAREQEEKAMDRVADRYKKEKGIKTAAAAPAKKK